MIIFRKTAAAVLALSLALLCAVPAFAADRGYFGVLAMDEDGDPRLAALDQAAEPVGASVTLENGMSVEVGQGYYEENRVFVTYRLSAGTDNIVLHEGAPDGEIEWMQVIEDWVVGDNNAPDFPDVQKENGWLDGKGQRWLESPQLGVQDGLYLEDGTFADIVAGTEMKQKDGSVIGWRECVVPEEKAADNLTFRLEFSCTDAIKFQDYSTFREYWKEGEKQSISFSLRRSRYEQRLQGVSGSEACRAEAELAMGRIDMKGTVRLVSPEQAASWIAWQEGEEGTGTDVIVCWNLYRNGEPVSIDLYGASSVNGTDEVVFEVMFPRMEDVSGLSLVPEYAAGGEKPDEAIRLEPANMD